MESYKESLNATARKRYEEKIERIGGVDPYSLKEKDMSNDPNSFAKVGFLDLVMYLVYGDSATLSLEELKAYKSLKAYNQFACGWVKQVLCASISEKKVFVGKVMHSQRLNEKPLVCWIIAAKEGTVETAHCNCMAGLGEACSHVAAVLFFIEFSVRHLEGKTVTDVAAYWPVVRKRVDPARVRDIDLSTPLNKYRKLECKNSSATTEDRPKRVPTPDDDIIDSTLLKPNAEAGLEAAVFYLMPDYAPPPTDISPIRNISSLYNVANESKSLDELQLMALSVDISVSEEEAKRIENKTRSQAHCKQWFHHRAGRITASKFKSVCCTSRTNPSISLVRSICYPDLVKFKTVATEWGCKHEEVARNHYDSLMQLKHEEFRVEKCGLFVNPVYPHFGASPDGVASCKCCGEGCVEIKCPICWDQQNSELPACIVSEGGKLLLDRSHAYYYQIQAQLFVSQKKYCDFVVWKTDKIYLERIFPDETFWSEKECIATTFFGGVILPEILGKAFTRKTSSRTLQNSYIQN